MNFSKQNSLRWIRKRDGVLNTKFNVKDVLNFHYSGKELPYMRDNEIEKLDSTESFSFPVANFNSMFVPIFSCKFCPLSSYHHVVATSDEDGSVAILHIDNLQNPAAVVHTHRNAVFDVVWVPDDKKLLTLSGDHSAKLWDVANGMACLSTFSAHSKSVRTADFRPQDPATFATGSRDGTVMLWDTRSQRNLCHQIYYKFDKIIESAVADFNLKNKNKISACPSVTGIAFQDHNTLLTCGSTDQYIRIWDMRLTYRQGKASLPRARITAPRSGFTDLKLSPCGSLLYASTFNGPIYCYNLNATIPQLIAIYKGHEAASYYIKTGVSSDGKYLVSGSSQKEVCIWRTTAAHLDPSPREPFTKLIGHSCEVAAVDISLHAPTTLVSCSDDGVLMKWRPTRNVENKCASLERDLSRLKVQSSDHPDTQTTSSGISIHYGVDFISSQSTDDWVELRSEANDEALVKRKNLPQVGSPRRDENTIGAVEKAQEAKIQEPERFKIGTPPREKAAISQSLEHTPTKRSNVQSGSKRKWPQRSPCTPTRCSKRLALSPKINKQAGAVEYRSPTLNLPNYVLDGTGPAHRCTRSRQKENLDWLTQMGRVSASKRSESTEKLQGSREMKSGKGKRPRNKNNKPKTSRKTLLQYYRKTTQDNGVKSAT